MYASFFLVSWIFFFFLNILLFCPSSQLKRPSLTLGGRPLYMQSPPQLEEATRGNLTKKLKELFNPGDQVTVTDRGQPFALSLIIYY